MMHACSVVILEKNIVEIELVNCTVYRAVTESGPLLQPSNLTSSFSQQAVGRFALSAISFAMIFKLTLKCVAEVVHQCC